MIKKALSKTLNVNAKSESVFQDVAMENSA